MEVLAESLRAKNQQLSAELERARQELAAWDTIYRDFKAMQQQLMAFEQVSKALTLDRDGLQQQLIAARLEIETLQRELINLSTYTEKQPRNAKKGGPAAPENADDLKQIQGVSPAMALKLVSMGIHTFQQISRWDDDAVIAFARALGISPGKMFQEDWVGQARILVGEKQV
jgi:predicted flap endonuclease-1-like 5' DNA nuclease